MSNVSTEGRTHSGIGIHIDCFRSVSEETQMVDTCIKNNWVLHEYVKAMKNNGNLTAETLSDFFWFAAETIDEVGNAFDDVDIDNIDWEENRPFSKGSRNCS